MYPQSKIATISESGETRGTGWLPPFPDLRDHTEGHPHVAELAKKIGTHTTQKSRAIPPKVDLRKWDAPIEDQGSLNSCSAHAVMGIIEYFEKRAHGKYVPGSRLFVYKATRNLMGVTGDTGAWLRCAMGALAVCGVPEEKYWPYVPADVDKEPWSYVYAVATQYEALNYFCYDPFGKHIPPATVLASIKKYLAAGVPSMFGFYGFPSGGQSNVKGGIPYPVHGEHSTWAHAVVAVGYDDTKKIKNLKSKKETVGALLIRNSWGTTWGDHGYGWLPFDYVHHRLASDFWSLLAMKWIDTKEFGF